MCGIVGLFLKNPALNGGLGGHLETMLIGMTERGPDSTGFDVYRADQPAGCTKVTLYHPDPAFDWAALAAGLDPAAEAVVRGSHAVLASPAPVNDLLNRLPRDVAVMAYGAEIEIYKDMGLPAAVADRFGLTTMTGSHGIGHTRMATESAVTTEHSHPFIAGPDTCLVHNGSLSNYNRLRAWLVRRGMTFATDNDSEVAARYVAYRMDQGLPLREALTAGLSDLDGFYTFAVGTRDGFAVLRDGIACKPAVLAETDDWVAMASEFRSLAGLPGIEAAKVWEPAPGVVYSWANESMEQAA